MALILPDEKLRQIESTLQNLVVPDVQTPDISKISSVLNFLVDSVKQMRDTFDETLTDLHVGEHVADGALVPPSQGSRRPSAVAAGVTHTHVKMAEARVVQSMQADLTELKTEMRGILWTQLDAIGQQITEGKMQMEVIGRPHACLAFSCTCSLSVPLHATCTPLSATPVLHRLSYRKSRRTKPPLGPR
jgi:hypothetical protein